MIGMTGIHPFPPPFPEGIAEHDHAVACLVMARHIPHSGHGIGKGVSEVQVQIPDIDHALISVHQLRRGLRQVAPHASQPHGGHHIVGIFLELLLAMPARQSLIARHPPAVLIADPADGGNGDPGRPAGNPGHARPQRQHHGRSADAALRSLMHEFKGAPAALHALCIMPGHEQERRGGGSHGQPAASAASRSAHGCHAGAPPGSGPGTGACGQGPCRRQRRRRVQRTHYFTSSSFMQRTKAAGSLSEP